MSSEARGMCKKHYTRWRRHGDPLVVKNLPKGSEPYDSILKYGTTRWEDCILYQGPRDRKTGYGQTYGKKLAHRAVYEKWWGSIPEGGLVDHVCHNLATWVGRCSGGPCNHRLCIHPGHLRIVNKSENSYASKLAAGRTHCRRGHEYTPDNTYYQVQSRGYGRPGRVCRTCRRERTTSNYHS